MAPKEGAPDCWRQKQLAQIFPHSIGTCSFRIRSFGKGRRAARGRGVCLPARSPPESPRFVRPESSIWLIIPQTPPGSLRRSRGSPRTGRSARRRAALKTIVSREGGGDFFAQLLSRVGHIFHLEASPRLFIRKSSTHFSDDSFVSNRLMAFSIISFPYIKLNLSRTPSASFKYFSAWSRSPLFL